MTEPTERTASEQDVRDWRELIDDATPTMRIEAFVAEHSLTLLEVRQVLSEYRSECGWSPYIGRDEVDSDFLNWYKWERLG